MLFAQRKHLPLDQQNGFSLAIHILIYRFEQDPMNCENVKCSMVVCISVSQNRLQLLHRHHLLLVPFPALRVWLSADWAFIIIQAIRKTALTNPIYRWWRARIFCFFSQSLCIFCCDFLLLSAQSLLPLLPLLSLSYSVLGPSNARRLPLPRFLFASACVSL